MTAPTPREIIDLSGPWVLRADPGDEGQKQSWWRFFTWWDKESVMQVPGAWQKVLGCDYHGIAWLARVVRVPEAWTENSSRRIRLRFDSVATDAIIQVNGIEIGRHSGDYLPFEFDINDAARLGWGGKAPLNPPFPGGITICLRIDEVRGVGLLASAVTLIGTQHWAVVQVQPGVFERRRVEAADEGANEVIVTSGVRPGERVVSDNALLLLQQFRMAEQQSEAAAAPAASAPSPAGSRP